MVVTQERVIDWLERQIGFVKANHLENCLMKYKNYIRLCKNVYRIAFLYIVLAKDCILDIIP